MENQASDNVEVKFLVIRFSSIGDIVLTTPVVRCLKEQVEGSEVHFLTKKEYSCIVESNPYIDKVHCLDNNMNELLDILRDEFYDYIIDLHNNIRSNKIKSRLKIVSFSFNKLNVAKWLMVNFRKNKLPDVHIVDRYIETTKVFSVENDMKGLDFFIPDGDMVNLQALPDNFGKGYVAFVIGAKHFTKKLPVSKIISICKMINSPVVLLGGDDDVKDGEAISNEIGQGVYNACGKYNLNQSASLIKQSAVVISNDTGLMHIAAAFHKKIISVWGNTIPEFGMYPYFPGENSEIIQVSDLKCRPCTKLGFKECPKKHFQCMLDIDEERIVKLVSSN